MASPRQAGGAGLASRLGLVTPFAALADGGAPPTASSQAWFADQRTRAIRWRRFLVGFGLLAGLYYVADDVAVYSSGAGLAFGLALLVPFGVAYLVTFMGFDRLKPLWFCVSSGVLVAVFILELPFAHAEAFVLCQYIAVVLAFRLAENALPIVGVMTFAAVVVPAVVPSWHEGLMTGVDNATAVMIPILAFVVIGALRWQRANRALTMANAEIARLAAENERVRIARDLHDLLGHSLTTITVKASLARRLVGADAARAALEIGEVEALARRSLAEVRATVSSYREVTLAGELAAGRELLRAAGIEAELPGSVDVVPGAHSELFGWVVREGLTNVVRHSRARWCTVRLSPSSVEVVDDGAGTGGATRAATGNGLSGLRERVATAGGTLEAGPVEPRGWRLRASLPAEAADDRDTWPALSKIAPSRPAVPGLPGAPAGAGA